MKVVISCIVLLVFLLMMLLVLIIVSVIFEAGARRGENGNRSNAVVTA
jgi:hypothetical protein